MLEQPRGLLEIPTASVKILEEPCWDLVGSGLFQKHTIWKTIHFGLEMVIFGESQFMSVHVNIMSISCQYHVNIMSIQ